MMRYNNSGKTKLMVAILIAVVILILGVAVLIFKQGGSAKNAKPEKLPVTSVSLGDFIVNLADPGQMRYLKTNIVLEVEGEVAKAEGGEGGADPRVRDAVIDVLSSRRFAELAKPGGKDALKEDIIASVNKRLEDAKAVDVYFNDFAMQ